MTTVFIERPTMAKSNGGFGNTKNDRANLPQEVVIKNYPETVYGGLDEELGDSQPLIDEQVKSDVAGLRKHKAKRKF